MFVDKTYTLFIIFKLKLYYDFLWLLLSQNIRTYKQQLTFYVEIKLNNIILLDANTFINKRHQKFNSVCSPETFVENKFLL